MSDPTSALVHALAVVGALGALATDSTRIDRSIGSAFAERAQVAAVLRRAAAAATEPAAGIVEVPAYAFAANAPTDGGGLPAALGEGRDRYGTPFGYCPARVGTFATPGNRVPLPGAPSSTTPMIAIVLAGPDRAFSTSCAGALAGAAAGDDRAVVERHHNLLRLRYALAAGIKGKSLETAQRDCAASGKLFLPYAAGADATGCK